MSHNDNVEVLETIRLRYNIDLAKRLIAIIKDFGVPTDDVQAIEISLNYEDGGYIEVVRTEGWDLSPIGKPTIEAEMAVVDWNQVRRPRSDGFLYPLRRPESSSIRNYIYANTYPDPEVAPQAAEPEADPGDSPGRIPPGTLEETWLGRTLFSIHCYACATDNGFTLIPDPAVMNCCKTCGHVLEVPNDIRSMAARLEQFRAICPACPTLTYVPGNHGVNYTNCRICNALARVQE